jgi:hypothetical protein
MPLPSTLTPIATITLTSASATVTFSSIPQTYTDLMLVANGAASTGTSLGFRFNSDSGNNYSYTALYGSGSSAASLRGTNNALAYVGNWYTSFDGALISHIQNYSNTTTNKTILSRNGNASNYVWATTSLWRSTAAISTILISADGQNFSSGSSFTLYGIKAA